MRLKSLRLREQNGFESQKRKDEIHAFKIKALKDREYKTKLAIWESEIRLAMAQTELKKTQLMNFVPDAPKSEEIAREATQS